MKDLLGQEVEVGDTIVFSKYERSIELSTSKVVGINATKRDGTPRIYPQAIIDTGRKFESPFGILVIKKGK